MKIYTKNPTISLSVWTRLLGATLMLSFMVHAIAFSQTYANPSPVPLLTAGTYGALASSGITGNATVSGDIGTISSTVGGTITATGTNWNVTNPSHNTQAQTDLSAALGNANGRTNDLTISNALGGQVLQRGVYTGGALDLATGTTLTLDAMLDPNAVFILRSTSSLIINTNSTVSLINGAVWSNVFWYVGSDVTIFSGTTFNGVVLAVSSITLNSTATQVIARLLANTGSVTINSTVLPVELVSFTARTNQKNADLRWSTATEVRNYGFDIERRQSAGWAKVGFVAGAGSSNSSRDYSYADNNLPVGRYTYRLKQIDNNGTFSYYGSLDVEIGSVPQASALLQNYPNPFNPSTMIQYNLAKVAQVSLKVYNLLGSEVATLVNDRQESGSYTVSFSTNRETASLSSGVYIYRLKAGSFVSTKKLVIMK